MSIDTNACSTEVVKNYLFSSIFVHSNKGFSEKLPSVLSVNKSNMKRKCGILFLILYLFYCHGNQFDSNQPPSRKTGTKSGRKSCSCSKVTPSPFTDICRSVSTEDIVYYNVSSIVFNSANVSVNEVILPTWKNERIKFLLQTNPEYNLQVHKKVLHESAYSNTTFPSPSFTHTVIHAYANHHYLTIRPDDVWIAILVQFSFYVNKNAEQLRSKFVHHNGTLEIKVGSEFYTHGDFVAAFQKKIEENLQEGVSTWILPSFSTTTNDDKIASGIVLMSSVQNYFKFKITPICGIPRITLLGTLEDWEDILKRVEKLKEFGQIMKKWADLLTHVLNKFVAAKSLDVDPTFWKQIVHNWQPKGSPCSATKKYLEGWLSAFSVFDKSGEWVAEESTGGFPRVHMEKIPAGTVTVPVTIEPRGGDSCSNATFFAGHLGMSRLDDLTLSSFIGWGAASSTSFNCDEVHADPANSQIPNPITPEPDLESSD